MDFEEFMETIVRRTEETQGLQYKTVYPMFYSKWRSLAPYEHPEYRLPVELISLNGNKDSVVKISRRQKNDFDRLVRIGYIASDLFAENSDVATIILPFDMKGAVFGGQFRGCKNLKRITIPRSVNYIYQGSFEGCDSLEDIYYAGTEEEWNAITIEHEARRIADPKKLGLFVDIETYTLPGNEALFRAKIHYNCNWEEETNEDD